MPARQHLAIVWTSAAAIASLLCASCADRPPIRTAELAPPSTSAPSGPGSSPDPTPSGAPLSLADLMARLPDRDHIRAVLTPSPPESIASAGTGPWLSMASDATDEVDRFRIRWEAEIVTAALWRESGKTNVDLSGGSLTFDAQNAIASYDGMKYAFAKNADSYLFTNAKDDPSPLSISTDLLRSNIERGASAMHIVVDSIETFSEGRN